MRRRHCGSAWSGDAPTPHRGGGPCRVASTRSLSGSAHGTHVANFTGTREAKRLSDSKKRIGRALHRHAASRFVDCPTFVAGTATGGSTVSGIVSAPCRLRWRRHAPTPKMKQEPKSRPIVTVGPARGTPVVSAARRPICPHAVTSGLHRLPYFFLVSRRFGSCRPIVSSDISSRRTKRQLQACRPLFCLPSIGFVRSLLSSGASSYVEGVAHSRRAGFGAG